MALIRIHKTDNYTVMCNNHLREKQMSLKAMGLMSLMLSLPDNWEYSISGLTKLARDGKDSVMNALTELEHFGYLKRTRRYDERGRFAGYDYDIFEQPQAVTPYSENPYTDKPYSGKPNTENPPQLNTYTQSTNKQSTDIKKESKKEGREEDITNARESYDDIAAKHGIVDDEERAAVFELVRACQLNGQKFTNDRLERNLVNILTYPTKAERVTAIYQTIDSGAGIVKPKPDLHYDVLGIKSANRQRRYEDIINDCVYDFDDRVKSALWDFIAYRQANGKIMTNEALASLCAKLNRLYRPSDTVGKVKALQNAIRGGYSDIKDGEDWIAQAVREGKEQGKELFAEGVE